ncbi:hypothetical protein BC832DRAFT_549366 [Gaertneriomyces semiglobifer]|nr:hypothetical protein BC832DRAFT_549366 [Gaertneriomyces semiglobifer]
MFPDLYECSTSWALLMGDAIKRIHDIRTQKRASRKSHLRGSGYKQSGRTISSYLGGCCIVNPISTRETRWG